MDVQFNIVIHVHALYCKVQVWAWPHPFPPPPQEHTELKEKYACLQETISEQEIALVEMGKQLSL